MAIPKAPLGQEFGYDFQYAVFLKASERVSLFLDSYLYEPAFPPTVIHGEVYLAASELCRIYAPYLQIKWQDETAAFTYRHPLEEERVGELKKDEICFIENQPYVKAAGVVGRCLGKSVQEEEGFAILAVEGKQPVCEAFSSPFARKSLENRLHNKVYGEQNFSVWMEEAERIIPYRMYIPCSYRPGTPQKTIVCFHGGDANADYVFQHTDNEICLYAEKYGYLILALCSYRKYTFFGASKVPTGGEKAVPNSTNPCGLTKEQMTHCNTAEASVLFQIEDAKKRFTLDSAHLYAMGNSGGCLGIFQQIKILPKGYFKRVVCSGGMPSIDFLDTELLKEKRTRILLLMATEDIFDGQYTCQVGYPFLRERDVAVDFHPVGGGSHLLGWTRALDVIFAYFEQDYSK
ncbi:hypothetical protein MUB23_08945 [Cuneatibacter sp. NSJ-177]|uniref:hypothetical protein n=1 Tax=Cuneatibacter sp. NSJ-177 TaxID=2931401 RepID=UPI001FD1B07A|nr:hypothetical protein [Cuneatibacter sp. NSJ-177]MCJ7835517.1 hypothetical protein [Cuneatibacter sp. NSJ-177]